MTESTFERKSIKLVVKMRLHSYGLVSTPDTMATWLYSFLLLINIGIVSYLFFTTRYRNTFKSPKNFPGRYRFIVTIYIYAVYSFIGSIFAPKNSAGSDVFRLIIPQINIQIAAMFLFLSMKEFAGRVSTLQLFLKWPKKFPSVVGVVTIVLGVSTIVIRSYIDIDYAQAYFGSFGILCDVFTLVFIIIPTLRMISDTLKSDLLGLMRKRMASLLTFNIAFLLFLVVHVAMFLSYIIPDAIIDNASQVSHNFLSFIAGPWGNFLISFMLNFVHPLLLMVEQIFYDSALSLVENEASQDAGGGSFYLQASIDF